MKDLSIDLETLGRRPGYVIVSVGAVFFDRSTGEIGEKFYAAIDVEDSVKQGFSIDPSTVLWWLDQSDKARHVFKDPNRFKLTRALEGFSEFVHDFAPRDANYVTTLDGVWGNGSDFDNAILGYAYERLGMTAPWNYKHNRCLRTLRSMFPKVTAQAVGTHHNALDDAIYQAKLCAAIHEEMQCEREGC